MHGHERAGNEQQEDDGAPLPALQGKYVQADGQGHKQLRNEIRGHIGLAPLASAAADGDRRRVAQEAAYRFMQAMAGNEAGYEEAARALFAGDIGSFEQHSAAWPDDVREHAALLAADAFAH